jgi:hypothetical protein
MSFEQGDVDFDLSQNMENAHFGGGEKLMPTGDVYWVTSPAEVLACV